MKTNSGAELTVYALDAMLPLLRPDSYMHKMGDDFWMIHTPSAGTKAALTMGTFIQCLSDLRSVGTVEKFDFETTNKIGIWVPHDPNYWDYYYERAEAHCRRCKGNLYKDYKTGVWLDLTGNDCDGLEHDNARPNNWLGLKKDQKLYAQS